MPIHTVAPDEDTYVRILGADNCTGGKYDTPYIGKVGIVSSTGKHKSDTGDIELIFVDLHGMSSALVFNVDNIEYITKKEYFIGALGG